MKKELIAGFEFIVIIVSVFAFSYMMSFNFKIERIELKKAEAGDFSFLKFFLEGLRKPMFEVVSADSDFGCCSLSSSGEKCLTLTEADCKGEFAQGALCSATSFCQKGCCYDETLGIFDKNVLKSDCTKQWNEDFNCNLPGAENGCCVLGEATIFETAGQCETDTKVRGIGGSPVMDFRNINEIECIVLSNVKRSGACVLGKRGCKFVTEENCLDYGGQFNEGYLCTAEKLNTSCKKTNQTVCVEGKDGVYFLDSCGNPANIYDYSKLNNKDYWENIVSAENSCGNGGNANSKTCGNCNRFLGGVCASAQTNNFDVGYGNFYCKSTSCKFEGVEYKNGESWCEYDGKIGDGDDVVGSRHFKHICNQGEVQIEPCADFRNQICIQTNVFDINGTEVEFRNSACVANNWRECVSLNSEEDGLTQCAETLNCEVKRVDIDDKFSFDVCTPKYPAGFSLKDVRYSETAKSICGLASQKCTVVRKPKSTGGCKIAENGDCLTGEFTQKMNDFCRSLGDCGGEVNILGEYTENYNVRRAPKLNDSWINQLKDLANEASGQFVEVENYTEYLEAAGIISVPIDGEPHDIGGDMMKVGLGVAGIGYAFGVYATGSLTLAGLGSAASYSAWMGASPSMAGFAGAAIGAGIGMIAGMYLAKALGLAPLGTILMSVGGALVGIAMTQVLGIIQLGGLFAPILIAGIVLMVISLFFGGSKCKPKIVEFECKPWQPPTGGSDCEKCNNDPMKPCSEYRCQSLGAACELINKGSGEELCIDRNPRDATPPILSPQFGVVSENEFYSDITDKGFKISSTSGECVDAYTNLIFGIATNEPAQCKFDLTRKDFSEMEFDLGGNSFIYNHTTIFNLPDPSHGQSQGENWTGNLDFFIKCQDTHGIETPDHYIVNLCVNQGPDKTASRVRITKPENDALVSFNSTEKEVKIITNELAQCKWAYLDKSYLEMENSFICNDTLESPSDTLGYACKGVLPISGSENKFYIRCSDQIWLNESERNFNEQSFIYTLRKAEKEISIDEILPNINFESPTQFTTINLQVKTSGGGQGHVCAYSFSGYDKMIELFENGNNLHKQPLNVRTGRNKIYIECRDETRDAVRGEASFEIIYDESSPRVARVWREGNKMYLIISEKAVCGISEKDCRINLENKTDFSEKHSIDAVNGKTYFVKCKDEFGNAPSGCSVTVKAM